MRTFLLPCPKSAMGAKVMNTSTCSSTATPMTAVAKDTGSMASDPIHSLGTWKEVNLQGRRAEEGGYGMG